MKKKLLFLALLLAAVALAIFRVADRVPSADYPLNERVAAIFVKGGCLDCHSAEPELPAYFKLPVVGKIMKIQFVNLTNIMLGRLVVPELLQEQCTSGVIARQTEELLTKGALYEREMEGFAKVKDTLSKGKQTPSENAADFVLELIGRNKAS